MWSQPRASGAETLVFTHGYRSVLSYHVHVQVLRLIKCYTAYRVPGKQNILWGYRQMDTLFGVNAWFKTLKKFGGPGCGCCRLCCPFSFYHNCLAWPSSIKARRCSRVRTTALCVHTRACCPGEILWHAAGWWRWQAHIVPPLWLLLPVHAPIISSSTLVEPDWSTAMTHSRWHAKTGCFF